MIDYTSVKDTLVLIAKDFVYPQQVNYETNIYLGSIGTVDQGFIPFSTSISSVEYYVTGSLGTGETVRLSVLKSSSTLASATVPISTVGWNSISLSIGNLISKDLLYLRLVGSGSSVDCLKIGGSTVNDFTGSLYYGGGTYNTNLAFKVHIPDMVAKIFPSPDIETDSYPKITPDIIGRPTAYQRWINSKRIEETVAISFYIYSKYPSEIDLLSKYVERAIMMRRDSIASTQLVTPAGISPLSKFRENIFTRQVSFNLRMFLAIQ